MLAAGSLMLSKETCDVLLLLIIPAARENLPPPPDWKCTEPRQYLSYFSELYGAAWRCVARGTGSTQQIHAQVDRRLDAVAHPARQDVAPQSTGALLSEMPDPHGGWLRRLGQCCVTTLVETSGGWLALLRISSTESTLRYFYDCSRPA